MNYSDLTPAQQTQAESTFYDALLGLDPRPYDYELNAAGVITGRRPLEMRKLPRLPKNVRVTLIKVTATEGKDNRHAIRYLARMAITQPETVEATA